MSRSTKQYVISKSCLPDQCAELRPKISLWDIVFRDTSHCFNPITRRSTVAAKKGENRPTWSKNGAREQIGRSREPAFYRILVTRLGCSDGDCVLHGFPIMLNKGR